MTDPRERLLEVALERLFAEGDEVAKRAERERSDEASAKIVAAWKRGVTGTGLAELEDLHDVPVRKDHNGHAAPRPTELEPAGVPPQAGPRPVRVRRWASAAGLFAIAGAGLWYAGRSGAFEETHALRAARVVEVAALDGRVRDRRGIASGELVRVQGGPVAFSLASMGAPDAVFEATGGSEFHFHQGAGASPEIELRRGALTWNGAGPNVAFGVDLGAARVDGESGAVLAVHVFDEPAGEMAVSLESGNAWIQYAGRREPLVSGDRLTLPADPEDWASGAAREVRELCDALPWKPGLATSLSGAGWVDRGLGFSKTAEELDARLDGDALAWSVLREQYGLWRDERDGEFPPPLLDYLAWNRSPRAVALARELWSESPEGFTEDHLVAFYERGAFELDRELEALASISPEASGGRGTGMFAAAFFASRGDARGRALLELYAEPPSWRERYVGMEGWLGALIASRALEWLGDRTAWDRLLDSLRVEVRWAIDTGQEELAGFALLEADYFIEHDRDVVRLPMLQPRLAVNFIEQDVRVGSVPRVRDLLEQIAERW